MKKKEIILIGGGGHCRSVIDVIEQENRYTISGIIDKDELSIGADMLGYKIIGTDRDLETICRSYSYFVITVGQIKTGGERQKLFDSISKKGGKFPVIISPEAYVSKYAVIGDGTVIMHKAVVNSMARIGINCIINTASVIEHDVLIEDHCHISTGAFVNGGSIIRQCSFVGSNSTISQSLTVSESTVLGAGSVLLQNTQPFSLYAGIPAILKKSYNEK